MEEAEVGVASVCSKAVAVFLFPGFLSSQSSIWNFFFLDSFALLPRKLGISDLIRYD
jgi:hypothetical protein